MISELPKINSGFCKLLSEISERNSGFGYFRFGLRYFGFPVTGFLPALVSGASRTNELFGLTFLQRQ
jgi:hypothetical protein